MVSSRERTELLMHKNDEIRRWVLGSFCCFSLIAVAIHFVIVWGGAHGESEMTQSELFRNREMEQQRKIILQHLLAQWRVEINQQPDLLTNSSGQGYVNTPAFSKIMKLPVTYLSEIVKMIEAEPGLEGFMLTIAEQKIGNFQFTYANTLEWQQQFHSAKKNAKFNYKQFIGSQNTIAQKHEAIRELGALAIPYLMDDIKKGNMDFVSTLEELLFAVTNKPDRKAIDTWVQYASEQVRYYNWLRSDSNYKPSDVSKLINLRSNVQFHKTKHLFDSTSPEIAFTRSYIISGSSKIEPNTVFLVNSSDELREHTDYTYHIRMIPYMNFSQIMSGYYRTIFHASTSR